MNIMVVITKSFLIFACPTKNGLVHLHYTFLSKKATLLININ